MMGKKKCNFKFYKGGIHFLKKNKIILSMWKLTLGYSIGKSTALGLTTPIAFPNKGK
jgi:hypothetical protein